MNGRNTAYCIQLRKKDHMRGSNWLNMARGKFNKYALYSVSIIGRDGKAMRALFKTRRTAIREAMQNYNARKYDFRVVEVGL